MNSHPPAKRSLAPESQGFILLLGLVTSIQAICTTLTLPILPAIATELATSAERAQLTISGFLVGVACGQIVSGALSDRFGRRPILLGGTAISILAGVVCTVAPTIDWLIAFRVLQGIGGAAGMILGRAIVRDLFERDKALAAQSAIASVISIVPMAGPPLVGLLLPWLSWRAVYGLIVAITLTLGIAAWYWIDESLKRPDPTATDPRRVLSNCMEMLRRPESMSFVLIGCVTYGGLFAIIAMLAFILRDSFSLSATTAGWMLGATSIATWFGATLNHRLTGRMSVRRRLTSSTALSASSGLATLVGCWLVSAGHIGGVHGLAAIFVPMLIYTFSFGMTHPTTIVMSLQPLPHIAGTASALGASFQILSGALFVWTAGRLYDGTPAGLGYCVAAAGLFVFAMQVFVASRYSGK